MTTDVVKFFQNTVMTNTVAEALKDAYDYCQDTFKLTPLGNSVPIRDIKEVKQLASRGKVPIVYKSLSLSFLSFYLLSFSLVAARCFSLALWDNWH